MNYTYDICIYIYLYIYIFIYIYNEYYEVYATINNSSNFY